MRDRVSQYAYLPTNEIVTDETNRMRRFLVFFLLVLALLLKSQCLSGATHQDVEALISNALSKYEHTADKKILKEACDSLKQLSIPYSCEKTVDIFQNLCTLQTDVNTRNLSKINYWRFLESGTETGYTLKELTADAVSVYFNEFTGNSDYGHWYLEALIELYFESLSPTLRQTAVYCIVRFLRGDIYHEFLSPFLTNKPFNSSLQLIEECIKFNRTSHYYDNLEMRFLLDKLEVYYRQGKLADAIQCYHDILQSYVSDIIFKDDLLYASARLHYAEGVNDLTELRSLLSSNSYQYGIYAESLTQHSLREIEAEINKRHDVYNLLLSVVAADADKENLSDFPYELMMQCKQQGLQNIARMNHIVYNSLDTAMIKEYALAKRLRLESKSTYSKSQIYSLLLRADSLEEAVFKRLQWQLTPYEQTPIRPLLKSQDQKAKFDRIQEISCKPLDISDQYFAENSERAKLWSELMKELDIERTASRPSNYHQLTKNLAASEAIVDFVCFHHFKYQSTDSLCYMAIVAKKGWASPKCINLELDDDMLSNDHLIYAMVWQPIIEAIGDSIKTIYFSPAGQLSIIAHHAIKCPDGSTMSDHYDLQMLSSSNQFLRRSDNAAFLSLIAFGDIDYGHAVNNKAQNRNYYRSPTPKSNERFGIEPLDNSRDEIEQVVLQTEKHNIRTTLIDRQYADESRFKQISGNAPSIIHISTHGFYLKNADESTAMERCGLLMAGANRAWTTGEVTPGHDDGILTGDEIAALDLSGCRLVVLSACETGLGDMTDYEGVMGLQRAFKLAGAQTIVMSLWKVRDDVTALLMTRFYDHLMSGRTPHEAMREAQREVRRDHPNPRDWAAFVVLD